VRVGREEPLEQLGDRPARSLAVQRAPVDTEALDELAATSFHEFGVTVHGEGALHRTPGDLVVRDDDPDLPHPRPTLPHRPRTPPGAYSAIPIAIVHPYTYRDRYRDGTDSLDAGGVVASSLTCDNGWRARRDSNPQPSDP
jgi:hypothetical protein